MFSDRLHHVNSGHNGIAGKVLLALGGLAIVGQLGAVAMVADGQVRKAELRAYRAVAEQMAVRHCLESSIGATRHGCLLQARADAGNPIAMAAGPGTSIASSAALGSLVGAGSLASPDMPMVVPVNFMAY